MCRHYSVHLITSYLMLYEYHTWMDMTSKPEPTWDYQDPCKGNHVPIAEDGHKNTHKVFMSDTVVNASGVLISSSGLRAIRNNISQTFIGNPNERRKYRVHASHMHPNWLINYIDRGIKYVNLIIWTFLYVIQHRTPVYNTIRQ